MIEKLLLADQRIVDCLNVDYGIQISKLTFLSVGADMNASVYKAETQDQAVYFVKLKRGHHHDISIDVVELLQKTGIQQILPPIKTIHDQPRQRIDEFTLIVYPFIEGQNGFTRPLTKDQWITLGKALRQVHETKVPSLIQKQIRQETYSPKWQASVRSFYTHMQNAEPSNDESAIKLWEFMQEQAATIHHLVDRAEQLGLKLQKQSPKFVLCHSDIHGENVLLDSKNTLYIVDWDEPIMAPKERDLMYIGGGVGNVWNKPEEEAFFYRGYGETEVNREILAYYRYARIVEDMALFGQDLLLTTVGVEDRPKAYQFFIGMFAPQGEVEIALKTDEYAG